MKHSTLHFVIALVTVMLLAACDRQPSGPPATHYVTGEAFYLQKIALPKDAVFTVRLEDVSLMDEPAVTISEQRIELDGDQQPFDFKLGYNLEALPEGHVYAVSGRIEDDSGLRFINTEQHSLLLTGDAVIVHLKLDQVTPAGPAQALSVTPEFICRGNEPFWNLELRRHRLQLSRLRDEVEDKVYSGRYSRFSALDGGAGYQWQGLAKEGVDSTLVAEISLDLCTDSMSGLDGVGDYDYRLMLGVDDEQLEGCCNLLTVEEPASAVIYRCRDQSRLSAHFQGNGADARVRLDRKDVAELWLPIQESASGARYAAGGHEFWSKGSEALLTLAGAAAVQCQVAESVVRYQCDDEQQFVASFQVNAQGGLARLKLGDGSELTLPQQVSDVGARYAQGNNEFWSQGAGARLTLEAAEPVNCVEAD